MKNTLEKMFPLVAALFSLVLYLGLFRPPTRSLGMSAALLTFFTALAWTALIFLSRERWHGIRFFYALVAVLFSVLLTEVVRLAPAGRPQLRLLYGFNLLGIAIIEVYLHFSSPGRKKSQE